MQKILLLIAGICISGAAFAECPSGFDEIPLENIQVTAGGDNDTCAAGFTDYYNVDPQCTAHVQN